MAEPLGDDSHRNATKVQSGPARDTPDEIRLVLRAANKDRNGLSGKVFEESHGHLGSARVVSAEKEHSGFGHVSSVGGVVGGSGRRVQ